MALTKCGILLNNRSLVRVHKANNHLHTIRQEKVVQNRREIATILKQSIESMESKIEVINYLIK